MTLVFDNENKGKPSFTFVVATQTTEEDWREGRKELPIMQSLSKMTLDDVDVRVWVFFDNHCGLPICYNKAIDNIEKTEGTVIFTHGDITIRDALIFDKIIQAEQMGADVIAAVGSTFWGVPFGHDIQSQPLIWTKAACGHQCSGFMLHTIRDKDGNKTPYALPSSYGPAPMQVLVADGCFMCFTRKAIQAGLRWSDEFSWHFYDMDCSLQANKMGLKIMTAPILLQHDSMGQSVTQPEFMLAQKRFIDKWRNRQ